MQGVQSQQGHALDGRVAPDDAQEVERKRAWDEVLMPRLRLIFLEPGHIDWGSLGSYHQGVHERLSTVVG